MSANFFLNYIDFYALKRRWLFNFSSLFNGLKKSTGYLMPKKKSGNTFNPYLNGLGVSIFSKRFNPKVTGVRTHFEAAV